MATGGVKWPMGNPFRTLDDPAPAAARVVGAEPAVPAAAVLLGWHAPLKRPGWLRRLAVWLVLGWRWDVTAE
jgi:hypothetical protein